MKNLIACLIAAVVLLAVVSTGSAKEQELIGAGATFPYPLYSKMFDVYSKEYGVKVNYQSIGSGGGIRQLINKTVDFGGSDAVMSAEDLKAAQAPAARSQIPLSVVISCRICLYFKHTRTKER